MSGKKNLNSSPVKSFLASAMSPVKLIKEKLHLKGRKTELKEITGKSHELRRKNKLVNQSCRNFSLLPPNAPFLVQPSTGSLDDGKGTLVRGYTKRHISGYSRDDDIEEADREAGVDKNEKKTKRDKDKMFKLLAEMSVESLQKSGFWLDLDVSQVNVEDCSGAGGSFTYRISHAGIDVYPSAVALHSRTETVTNDDISESITEAAAIVLAKANLTPPRLAHGSDWFLELWEGKGAPSPDANKLPARLGKKIAEMHSSVDTEWYDSFRQKLKERYPFLRDASDGSHIWYYANRADEWLVKDGKTEAWQQAYCSTLYEPVSKIGTRIVTTHGDLHRENLIETKTTNETNQYQQDSNGNGNSADTELKFIDLEFTIVTHAIQDLAYVINACEWGKQYEHWNNDNENHRAFLRAYLEAMERFDRKNDVTTHLVDNIEDEIEILLLDCIVYKELLHSGSMAPWAADEKVVKLWKDAISKLASTSDKETIINDGEVWESEAFLGLLLEQERRLKEESG